MQLNDELIDDIHGGGAIDFVSDLPDIHNNDKRRGSVHDQEELPAGTNDNARDSEEEEVLSNGGAHFVPDNQIQNGNQVDSDQEHSSDDPDNVQYQDDAALSNGARNEKKVNHGFYDSTSDSPYVPGSHNRMDTAQQVAIAEQVSLQQGQFEEKLAEYTEKISVLEGELKMTFEENEKLKAENSNLQEERDRFAKQSQEIQDDWDRMSGYMTQILSEVQYIEDQRKQGQDITTPTPKLHDIFEAIQKTISRPDNNTDISLNIRMGNGFQAQSGGSDDSKPDLYENVADLFSEKPPNGTLKIDNTKLSVVSHDKRKLSFGAVNELFSGVAPREFMNGVRNGSTNNNHNSHNSQYLNGTIDPSSSSSLPSKNNNNSQYLQINDINEHEKRLSYGGVGLLFDANTEFAAAENERNNANNNQNVFNPNNFKKHSYDDKNNNNPLKVSFKPTYDGIAALFDENNDILGTDSYNKHNKKPTFGGDIVELFTDPNNDFVHKQNVIDEEAEEEEEDNNPTNNDAQDDNNINNENGGGFQEDDDSLDSMDEQRIYTYSHDDEDEEDEEDQYEADKDKNNVDEDDDDDDDDEQLNASNDQKLSQVQIMNERNHK